MTYMPLWYRMARSGLTLLQSVLGLMMVSYTLKMRKGFTLRLVLSFSAGFMLECFLGSHFYIPGSTPQALLSKPMELVEALVALTRAATGATEVMTGEAIGANMSGAAIAQLQSQAGQPVEELRERFWDVQRKQGEVLAQFFRLYYYEEPYIYEDTEAEAEGGDVQMAEGLFTGAEFDAMRFDVVVETVRGSKSSNAGDINLLDTLLARGAIDVDTYLEAYPDDAISDKSALREALMRGKEGQLGQALAQVEQLQAQLAALRQEQAATEKALLGVRTLAEQFKRLQKDYAELYAEATQKILAANGQIEAGNAAIAETTADATEFAATLAANGMVPGEVRG